ncbi:hypothetical protein PBY51_001137 [Eleginops maclovinus]|uniref:Uncharacterized protein n=1 Tax=Eleginops maclovinus TaxID=56733 RepID=A0AAN8AIR2_ELEMC|nr:hypothetical protein PBY51_001137 [Eleginops maclovinus]
MLGQCERSQTADVWIAHWKLYLALTFAQTAHGDDEEEDMTALRRITQGHGFTEAVKGGSLRPSERCNRSLGRKCRLT